jgi:hypothetical protein
MMADSLVISNSIELLTSDTGPTYSVLPNLENTIFALDDQNGTYDLGTPQPTVDILASLITDGERPQGRRASNRTLTIPVAIISDTRDNLALARETLFALVDQQWWTLTYTRSNTNAGPLILDCWRAEPTVISYNQPTEQQFACQLVLTFEALPYGRSDTPNEIDFLAPLAGSSPPPAPIVLDTFSTVPPGQQALWLSTTASVQGNSAVYCPSPAVNGNITNPIYQNFGIGTNDLTVGTGEPLLNVIQFWAGFASVKYFHYWANHQSEVRFIVTLSDVNGETVSYSRQYVVSESNNMSAPKWTNIEVRIPLNINPSFDWAAVTGFSIKVQNFHDAMLHGSNVFLDICSAVAESAAAANTTRGSIYRLNGIEGSVHTPLSIAATQQPSTSPTVVVLPSGTTTWLGPAGVTNGMVENLGPGGAGASVSATAFGGGAPGGEYARENRVAFTAGKNYAPTIPSGPTALASGAGVPTPAQTIFPGDDKTVVANGGLSVAFGSATGPNGASGSTNSVHNNGGKGANGSSPNGGGGGGSGGSGGGATFVDDTSGTFTYAVKSAPPQLVSAGIPESRAPWNAGNGVLTYGSQIVQQGISSTDTIVVAMVADSDSGASINVVDTQGNTYTFIYKAQLSDGEEVQVFYARPGNQPDGTLTPLSPGDDVFANLHSTPDNYYAFVYVLNDVTGIHGNTGTTGSGTATGDFTGTSGSFTASGLSAGVTHLVFTLTDNASSMVNNSMSPAENPTVDTENFSTVGSGWGDTNLVMNVFWKDADSSSSTTFSFTRSSSTEVAALATSWNANTSTWSSQSGNSLYHSGTHHFTNLAGKKATISFTGQQAQVIGVIGPNQGQMYVSVDSAPYQVIDNYWPVYQYQTVIFDTGLIANTSHTIDILTLGQSNAQSSNTWIDIDGYQILSTSGAGLAGSGATGGTAVTGGGAGGNGGTNANGSAGGVGGGGGGAASTSGTKTGGAGGAGQVQITYTSSLPAFKTLVLHRPSLDGSFTLLPYIACASTTVPTNDQVQGITTGVPPHFKGTYSMMVVAGSGAFNSPSSSRTVTVTVNEYEFLGGPVTATQSVSRTFTPSTDPTVNNGMATIGELTLPTKDIPPENFQAVYFVSVNSSNASDTIQDVIMIDTMGQTVVINESTGYAQYYVDEPLPNVDIGRIMGSKYDRDYAISVLDFAFPSGGPITVEAGDNILFAYCVEGAPALVATYFPRYYIDRTVS